MIRKQRKSFIEKSVHVNRIANGKLQKTIDPNFALPICIIVISFQLRATIVIWRYKQYTVIEANLYLVCR